MNLKKSLEKQLKKKSLNKNKYFYPLKVSTFDNQDLIEGINVIISKNMTMSKKTLMFENFFKKKMKFKNSLMVNSGSSANLLAFQCLINPYRKKKLNYGDEVLIPVICWSTSLWPIIQSGLKPVFVDVDVDTLNISINDLKKKITKKTKALIVVHTLGNSANMKELLKVVKKNKLFLIEDTCESLGSKYKNKFLGSFGDFSTFSFYYSHQISSVEGGMICCKSKEDLNILQALRSHGWSKNTLNQKKYEKENKKLNKNFLFVNSGFNLRPTDIQAAIGLSQFKKLNYFIKMRDLNRKTIIKSISDDKKWTNQVKFIQPNKDLKVSWFGIPMILNKRYENKKNIILNKLDSEGIENRPIISGNFTKQPALKKYNLNKKYLKYPNADIVHDLGVFIGLKIKKITNDELLKFKTKFFSAFNDS